MNNRDSLRPVDDDDVIYDVIATCRYRILRHSTVTYPQKQLWRHPSETLTETNAKKLIAVRYWLVTQEETKYALQWSNLRKATLLTAARYEPKNSSVWHWTTLLSSSNWELDTRSKLLPPWQSKNALYTQKMSNFWRSFSGEYDDVMQSVTWSDDSVVTTASAGVQCRPHAVHGATARHHGASV